jgi:hypothetical protein
MDVQLLKRRWSRRTALHRRNHLDEYRKHVEKDAVCVATTIFVSEPIVEIHLHPARPERQTLSSTTVCIDFMLGGDHAVEPLYHRPFPLDKAIDLMDEAAAR